MPHSCYMAGSAAAYGDGRIEGIRSRAQLMVVLILSTNHCSILFLTNRCGQERSDELLFVIIIINYYHYSVLFFYDITDWLIG